MNDIEIDELDRDILNVLLEDGRKSFRKVAEEVGSTPATVINRVNRLQDEGVITGYSADVDYRALGFDGLAVVEVVVEGKSIEDVKEHIEDKDNVVSAFTITGDTDIVLIVKFRDRDELKNFVQEELGDTVPAEKTITHLVLDVLKEGEEPRL